VSVLVVNAGSSSLKVSVLGTDGEIAAALELSRWDGSADHPELRSFLAAAHGVSVAGHRVVHGGAEFTGPALIDDEVIRRIGLLSDLAPLHQPAALAGIAAVRAVMPLVPAVACFDTSFHATLPAAASTYALPGDWNRRFGLRRYGFHGLSHAYASRRAASLAAGHRIVTCHLGAGASLAAVLDGVCVDTTMGFTPLEGLVMATRSGSVDPGLILWLVQHGGLSADELSEGLEQRSGLAGLSELAGGSADMRDVRAAAAAGDSRARLALEVYSHRLAREIAAMAAALNGLDVLVFTGGVGENDQATRAGAAERLAFLGVAVDQSRNARASRDEVISPDGAQVTVLRITAREDIEIARQALGILGAA